MKKVFDVFSSKVTAAAGSPVAFISAFLVIIGWAVAGPVFHFSDTWQLVINTSTTIITFLMVFVIQQTQNKDTKAMHLKLNELIACNKHASNRLIDIEDLSTEEIDVLKRYYVELSQLQAKDENVFSTHSLDEARRDHAHKRKVSSENRNAAQ